jgi:hypothetical protein
MRCGLCSSPQNANETEVRHGRIASESARRSIIMLKTHGVTSLFDGRDFGLLKRQALLFDNLYIYELTSDEDTLEGYPEHLKADVEFLQESGVIADPAARLGWPVPVTKNDRIRNPTEVCDDPDCESRKVITTLHRLRGTIDDTAIRLWAGWLATDRSAEYVPVCRRKLRANAIQFTRSYSARARVRSGMF